MDVDVPAAFVGLRILLVDPDTTSLSNMKAILEEHSFKVTPIEQATVALSILREQIDQFDLVMVDVNMPEMDYLEFIKSTQLIKDKPIILMSPKVKTDMVKEAIAQGACYIFTKPTISSIKLKNLWRHVYRHNKKENEKSKQNKDNQVEAMDNTSFAKKLQDGKGKGIANCSKTYQDQAVGALIEKEEDQSLLSKISTETPENKRQRLKWTPDLDEKLDKVVRELGEKARPRHILEGMSVPDLTKEQVTYRLQKHRSQKQEAPNVQPATSMNHSNEPLQKGYIPQSPEVPFIFSPSRNDYSLNGWNHDWDELLEFGNFGGDIRPENQDNVSTSKSQNP